jgi:hypothetical protein
MWRKACALWCDINSGLLHQPLGPWLHHSASLRRTWPFHWDTSSGRLLVRHPDGYSSHRPFSHQRTFHLHSNRVISTLPPSCHPIEVLETRIGFTRSPCPDYVPPPSSSPATSFQHCTQKFLLSTFFNSSTFPAVNPSLSAMAPFNRPRVHSGGFLRLASLAEFFSAAVALRTGPLWTHIVLSRMDYCLSPLSFIC